MPVTRERTLHPAVGTAAAGVCAALLAVSGLLRPVELPVHDAILRRQPRVPASRVAVVLVDEPSLRAEGAWPWERAKLAALLDAAGKAGARGVVIDLLLPEAREGDPLLAAALASIPSALGAGISDRGRWLLPSPSLGRAAVLAHVAFDLDRDGVVRRLAATREAAGPSLQPLSLPALSLAAARLLEPERPIPVGTFLRPGFRAVGTVPVVPAARLLRQPEAGRVLEGKVVFVGASAAGLGDRVVTPLTERGGSEPGVVAQAEAAESILAGDLLSPLPPVVAGALAVVAAVLVAAAGTVSGGARVPLMALAALTPFAFEWVAAGAGFELAATAAVLPVVVLATAWEALAAGRFQRETASARKRVGELSDLAASLEADRRDASEARRVVAHELRTPLTSVKGLAQLLAGYDLTERERRRVAGLVESEANRLSEMVEGLLDLERLKLKEFAAHAVRVDLSALAIARAGVLGGGGRLVPSIEGGLAVRGDPALLSRLVDNLVGNAFKFSPPSEPVDLVLRTTSEGAALEVRDRGPGIPREERTAVFRRFARGSAAAAAPGLGLGLAFVSEVAGWHRGRVELEAPPTGGSLFRVIIPLAPGGRA